MLGRHASPCGLASDKLTVLLYKKPSRDLKMKLKKIFKLTFFLLCFCFGIYDSFLNLFSIVYCGYFINTENKSTFQKNIDKFNNNPIFFASMGDDNMPEKLKDNECVALYGCNLHLLVFNKEVFLALYKTPEMFCDITDSWKTFIGINLFYFTRLLVIVFVPYGIGLLLVRLIGYLFKITNG